MVNDRFTVRVAKSTKHAGADVSVTANGLSWNTLPVYDPERELPLISKAILQYLKLEAEREQSDGNTE